MFGNRDDEKQDEGPMFSPRNIVKFLSRNIEDFRKEHNTTVTKFNEDDINKEFHRFLNSISKQYKVYKKNNLKHGQATRKQQLEAQIKLGRIPSSYFDENYKIEKIKNKRDAVRKQEELQQYLDQIQLVIFSKTSKYPDKSFLYINNITSAEIQIQKASQKVHSLRGTLKDKLLVVVEKKRKIRKCIQVKNKIQKVMDYMNSLRKMHDLRCFAEKIEPQKLLTIEKQQIRNLKFINIKAIKNMVEQFEEYEDRIRDNSYRMFQKQFSSTLSKAMHYNKEEWLKSQIPDSAFNLNHQNVCVQENNKQSPINASYLNISVLDQSYFNIECSSWQVDTRKLLQLWNYMKTLGISQEQEEEINETIIKQLVKNNVIFSKDFEQYVSYIFKIKNISLNIKQNFESFKRSKHEDRIQVLNIKFLLKIIKVYYGSLKNMLQLIRKLKHNIPLLCQSQIKLLKFIKQRIQYFISLRKIDQCITLPQFIQFTNIIDYWINEDYLEDQLLTIRLKILEDYTLAIHKNIMVNELKSTIQQQTYKVISIPSEYIMVFHSILSWENKEETTDLQYAPISNNILQTSMSMCVEQRVNSIFRIIDKKIIIEGKEYKVCQSFLNLIVELQRYLQIKVTFQELQKNIDEKICEIVGFYLWYSKKMIVNEKQKERDKIMVASICLFVFVCELLEKIMSALNIQTVPKKVNKTNADIIKVKEDLKKQIVTIPYSLVQQQVSKIYESRLKTRKQIPTPQTMKIISTLQAHKQQISLHFSSPSELQYYLQPIIRMVMKNYFGYLMNLENRGKCELKWFLPEFKNILSPLFQNQIKKMEKQLSLK